MNLAAIALRRPISLLACAAALVLAAAFAWQEMPRDLLPVLDEPAIYVAQTYGGMDPAQMEGYLVYFFEYHFLYITGIEHVESKSIQGAALLKLQFHPGTDMAQAMAETVAFVNRARAFMPPGTPAPFITRYDAGSAPVGYLVFTSDSRSITELQDAALNRVRPLLATLPGVSSPPPFGGNARTIVVKLKPERLKSYRMSPDEVVQAISAANVVSPSGNLMRRGRYPMAPVNSIARNISELAAAPVRGGQYPAVFVRDVAEVADDSDIVTCSALFNGKPCVYVPVTKRAGASSAAVIRAVKANLARFAQALPSGVLLSYELDRSPVLQRAFAALPWEAVLSAALTSLVVLLFLRSGRDAIIMILHIPLALLAALVALWITGQTLNLMTLGGLTLSVGILVDEAIVCLENIRAHRTRGQPIARAALAAATETAAPRALVMLCLLIMFTPALFMSGMARSLFLPLSLAVGFAVAASYVLSSTLVPVLAVWLGAHASPAGEKPGLAKMRAAYLAGMQGLLRHSAASAIVYILVAAAGLYLAFSRLGAEIFPALSSNELQLRLRAPAGTDLHATEARVLEALEIIRSRAGAANTSSSLAFVGLHGSTYPINFLYLWNGGTEEALLQMRFKQYSPLLQKDLRKELARALPGVALSFEPADLVTQVMGLGAAHPIEVAISGPNLADNRAFAEKVLAQLQTVAALRDVQLAQSLDYPIVSVTVDRERSGLIGPDMADISRALLPVTWSSRFSAPNFWADPATGISYQVQVQMPQELLNSPEAIENIPLMESRGTPVLLRNVARVRKSTAPSEFDRFNMQRTLTIRANIAGAPLSVAAREVKAAITEAGPRPPGVHVSLRGQIEPLREMQNSVARALAAGIAAIYLLLAAHYQSFKLPWVILSIVPAVLLGAASLLWLTNTTINLQSSLGVIMSLGVALANAILLTTFGERAQRAGRTSHEAIVEAARTRFRPILMTSLAMILGVLPVAFGWSGDAGQMMPLARALLGGLVSATFAVLFLLPSFFALLQPTNSPGSTSLLGTEAAA